MCIAQYVEENGKDMHEVEKTKKQNTWKFINYILNGYNQTYFIIALILYTVFGVFI